MLLLISIRFDRDTHKEVSHEGHHFFGHTSNLNELKQKTWLENYTYSTETNTEFHNTYCLMALQQDNLPYDACMCKKITYC